MGMNTQREYERDFYSWTLHSAQLLREGKFSEIDIENVAEEIESMGRRDRRQLVNRLSVLIAHLLKWKHQPIRRSNSWKLTIKEQRNKVFELLEESPSLKHELESKLSAAYNNAVVTAAKQTSSDISGFPEFCPFTIEQCLNGQFFPE
jgi:hypothetical protein